MNKRISFKVFRRFVNKKKVLLISIAILLLTVLPPTISHWKNVANFFYHGGKTNLSGTNNTQKLIPASGSVSSQTENENTKVAEHQKIDLPILMYHHIRDYHNPKDKMGTQLSVSPQNFEEQMAYLALEKYNTISLQHLVNFLEKGEVLPEKPIILTFDDGYKDVFQNAYPILQKYHLKATFFVIVNKVDTGNYLSWDDVKNMIQNGMEIGSHTLNHPNLTKVSSEKAKDEIFQSKAILEEKLGQKINFFCYPSGEFNNQTIEFVKQAGYKAAVSIISGYEQLADQLYKLKRIRVSGGENIDLFKKSVKRD